MFRLHIANRLYILFNELYIAYKRRNKRNITEQNDINRSLTPFHKCSKHISSGLRNARRRMLQSWHNWPHNSILKITEYPASSVCYRMSKEAHFDVGHVVRAWSHVHAQEPCRKTALLSWLSYDFICIFEIGHMVMRIKVPSFIGFFFAFFFVGWSPTTTRSMLGFS